MAEMDFETASGNELYEWWRKWPGSLNAWEALRDRIVAQVEARGRAETVDREREAARKAWDAAASYFGVSLVATAARDRYLALTYPAPAPPSVTPCDVCGSPDGAHDFLHDCVRHLRKAFAATVEGR